MSKKSVKQTICARFFRWVLYERKGTFYADGRSGNSVNVGRHSLDTKLQAEAIARLKELDLKKAVEFGMAQPSVPIAAGGDDHAAVSLEDGRKSYVRYIGRPPNLGGASATTLKRYRAVFDKFVPFARKAGVESWNRVTKKLLISYGTWLHEEDYAARTQYLECTTILQTMKWLVEEKMIPSSCTFHLDLRRQSGTTTYCYTPAEVTAILDHCHADENLKWLGQVICTLIHTGLRISELASLRWSDFDGELTHLTLTDDRQHAKREDRNNARATKNHQDRTMPVPPQLRCILAGIIRLADGRVFHGPKGGFIKPDKIRKVLIRDVLEPLAQRFPAKDKKLGLIDGRVHSFRHYFCSAAAASGKVDENTLKTWLGHRDSAMIRVYFHAFKERSANQMSTIDFAGNAAMFAAKPN